jgi:hypothetical protein
MRGVVEAEAAEGADLGLGEWAEEETDGGGAVREGVGAEDVAGDDSRGSGEADVGGVGREDGVAVVDVAVAGEEAD